MLSRFILIKRMPVFLLTLFALLLAGPVGTSAYVLCIGADGHAAVEQEHSGECGLAGGCQAPDQVGTHCYNSTRDSTPCTDIQPSLSTVTHRNEPILDALAAGAAALLIPPVTLPLPSAAFAASLPRHTDATNPCLTLQVLRTTVLRC